MNTLSLNRRRFLRGLALGGAAAATFQLPLIRRAHAAQVGKRMLFVHMGGGWDILLGLDGRDPRNVRPGIQLAWERQNEAQFREAIDTGRRDLSGDPYFAGPCLAPMMSYLDRAAILRGVVTDTVSHNVGAYYWYTGRFPAGENPRGSSVATAFAAELGGARLVPHLAINIQTFNEGLPAYATGLSVLSPGDFGLLLGPGRDPRYSAEVRALLQQHAERQRCFGRGPEAQAQAEKLRMAQGRARQAGQTDIARDLDLFAPDAPAEVAAVRERFGADPQDPYSAASYAAMSFLALKSGLADAVSLTLVNTLDTHGAEWAFTQGPAQLGGFRALASLVGALLETPSTAGAGSLLDDTLVVVASEFGRTPTLNGSGGRDHWPNNAALLLGAGVKPGIYGRSTDQLFPENVDPLTGRAVSSGGVPLRPEGIYTSVLQNLGFDTLELRAQPLPFLLG